MGSDRFRDYVVPLGLLLGLNLVLGGLKLSLGIVGESTAMRSDGWNNSADFLYTLVLGGGLWISSQPADSTHPEGHGRFESLFGLFVAVIILATGAYVLYDAGMTIWSPTQHDLGLLGISVLVVSAGLKGGIAYYLLQAADRLESPALRAIGWDQAGDILMDLTVIGALVASATGWLWIDPSVAAVIGLMILTIGWEPLVENVQHLTGYRPDQEMINQVRSSSSTFEAFGEAYNVRAHHVGPAVHVSLNVQADPQATLETIHEAEEKLREHIVTEHDVTRVFIHIEPRGTQSPN